jgi:hypothetical protein
MYVDNVAKTLFGVCFFDRHNVQVDHSEGVVRSDIVEDLP